jgi:hypothetical protein
VRACIDVATNATYTITQEPKDGCVTPIQLVDRRVWLATHKSPCDVSAYVESLFGFLWSGSPLTTTRAVFLANEAMSDWYQLQPGGYHDAVEAGHSVPWYDFVKYIETNLHDLGPATPMFVVLEQ